MSAVTLSKMGVILNCVKVYDALDNSKLWERSHCYLSLSTVIVLYGLYFYTVLYFLC